MKRSVGSMPLSIDPHPALLKSWQRVSLVHDLVEVDTATLLQYNTMQAKYFLKLPLLSSN